MVPESGGTLVRGWNEHVCRAAASLVGTRSPLCSCETVPGTPCVLVATTNGTTCASCQTFALPELRPYAIVNLSKRILNATMRGIPTLYQKFGFNSDFRVRWVVLKNTVLGGGPPW